MKILFVTPWVPGPTRPRSLGFLTLLGERNDISIVSLCRGKAEEAAITELSWPTTAIGHRFVPGVLRAGFARAVGRSMQTAFADVRPFRERVRTLIRDWRPDVVHLNVFRTVHLVSEAFGTPTIVDLDEFRSDYYAQLQTAASPLRRFVGRHEARIMAADELRLLETEAHFLLSAPVPDGRGSGPNVHVVRTPFWASDDVTATLPKREILFVGRLSYEANIDGLRRFMTEVWPTVRVRYPDATMRIVGAAPKRTIRELARQERVDLSADVPDVLPFYRAAAVSVVPVDRATGVQMKLIQASALGVPSIVTPRVAELGGVSHGREVLVASTRDQWIDAISRLFESSDAAGDLSLAARRWYESMHSPAAVKDELERAYGAAVEGGE